MKLRITPEINNPLLKKDLQLVITMEQDGHFEVYIPKSSVKPDRHLLLGIAQSMAFQIEEKDPETVVFAKDAIVQLDADGSVQEISSSLIMVRTLDEGAIAALVRTDSSSGKRLARQVVRALTGTIRLDVP
ncbi:MAG: hypothetical protein PHS86_06540 [Syntrophaceae bacterium]|nr:hypothetical protein [Syntrophaceae bacterium]